MEDPDSGYTIDQHLAPTGAAAHELASAGHRWIQFRACRVVPKSE
jgi:hypothetical protein